MPSNIPYVIERSGNQSQGYDLYSRLLKDRIIMLDTPVTDHAASLIIAQMMFLQSESSNDIMFYINSPGGSVPAGMAIYDVMQTITPDVSTIVIGQAMSMGSLLACGGAPGKRKIMPHAGHMIHQPSGGTAGPASDMEIQVREILRWKNVLTEIYVKHTKQTADKLKLDMERDNYMTAEQAIAYGLADSIIIKKKKVVKPD